MLKVGEMLGFADLFYSGLLKRPAHSIEVVLLYALVGDDYLCLPLDFHVRKPDPKGPGHRCLNGMELAQKMVEDLHHAMRVHFLKLDGHYLVADHTLRHMRSEFYDPSDVVDRQGWEMWQQAGALDARSRARKIARDILANHWPEPLDPEAESWIRGRFDLKI